MNRPGVIEQILCPVDFSESSLEAAGDVVDLAQKLKAHVIFLHVVNEAFLEDLERLGGRLEFYEGAAEKAMKSLTRQRREKLENLLAEKEAGRVSYESLVQVGIPWECILDTVEKLNIDMILMGAKGRGSLVRHLRFGSSAEKVFRRANCRVMFVR